MTLLMYEEGLPVVIRLATVLVKFDALPINVTYSNLQPNICVHEKILSILHHFQVKNLQFRTVLL